MNNRPLNPSPLPPGIEILPPEKPGAGQGSAEGPAGTGKFPALKILLILLLIVLYTASPLDLIPDFIPVLGQLDDLLIDGGLLAMLLRTVYVYYRGPKGLLKPLTPMGWVRALLGRWVLRKLFRKA